ncbi:MAG: hypothetical protein GDA42_13295 [Ekhidna sp.]|nr:hypothetical protein [Ekhidna sp.]
MQLFCLDDFKVEFEKLISRKSYQDLQKEMMDYFFDKSVEELKSGTRIGLMKTARVSIFAIFAAEQ